MGAFLQPETALYDASLNAVFFFFLQAKNTSFGSTFVFFRP